MWHNAPSEWSKPLSVLLCHQLSSLWKKEKKRGALKFLNVYYQYQLTILVENQKFLFFYTAIKNYSGKI